MLNINQAVASTFSSFSLRNHKTLFFNIKKRDYIREIIWPNLNTLISDNDIVGSTNNISILISSFIMMNIVSEKIIKPEKLNLRRVHACRIAQIITLISISQSIAFSD